MNFEEFHLPEVYKPQPIRDVRVDPEHGLVLEAFKDGWLASYAIRVRHGGHNEPATIVLEYLGTIYEEDK